MGKMFPLSPPLGPVMQCALDLQLRVFTPNKTSISLAVLINFIHRKINFDSSINKGKIQ